LALQQGALGEGLRLGAEFFLLMLPVEQANGVMKVKLRCWLADHEGQGWSDVLPDIAFGMNRQSHSSLRGKMPYEIFFNRKPRWEDRVAVGADVQVNQIEDKALGDQVGPIYYLLIIFLTLPKHHFKAQHPHPKVAQHPQYQAAQHPHHQAAQHPHYQVAQHPQHQAAQHLQH